MSRVILNVPDISCEHCQRTIVGALTPESGVQSVEVDIPTRRVTVDYDPAVVGPDRLEHILAEEDYPVASTESPAETRSRDQANLPPGSSRILRGIDKLPFGR
ncbi:MAG TPA: heavy-metal-associated domain-containing protein [Dehalococcoidia bacterium]|nr:heavy-metal-associated domain-containing protein [Dehalococcoidia bacterium]